MAKIFNYIESIYVSLVRNKERAIIMVNRHRTRVLAHGEVMLKLILEVLLKLSPSSNSLSNYYSPSSNSLSNYYSPSSNSLSNYYSPSSNSLSNYYSPGSNSLSNYSN